MSTTPGRPSVADVASLIRARTKDEYGNEIGTFDDTTRPTGDDVETHIDAAMALVGTRFVAPGALPADLVDAFAALVAYRAALRVEKSYFPEQVRSDRSAYDQLRQEYLDDLAALTDAVIAGGDVGIVDAGIGMLTVGSWTSIRSCVVPTPAGALAIVDRELFEEP